jgi:hypothetical protein
MRQYFSTIDRISIILVAVIAICGTNLLLMCLLTNSAYGSIYREAIGWVQTHLLDGPAAFTIQASFLALHVAGWFGVLMMTRERAGFYWLMSHLAAFILCIVFGVANAVGARAEWVTLLLVGQLIGAPVLGFVFVCTERLIRMKSN